MLARPRVKIIWVGATKQLVTTKPQRKPMRRISKKTRDKLPSRKACCEAVKARSNGYCEIRAMGCTVRMEHVHELIPRSQGGSITDPENCRASCGYCHHQIHHVNPNYARKMGWLKDNLKH